jgi:hypothetical protein
MTFYAFRWHIPRPQLLSLVESGDMTRFSERQDHPGLVLTTALTLGSSNELQRTDNAVAGSDGQLVHVQ